ncbi:hypothetical protein AHAS_Ahas11G0251900 [Arachis hypogaea]
MRMFYLRQISHTTTPPDILLSYLRKARFEHLARLRNFYFDNTLISVFVER